MAKNRGKKPRATASGKPKKRPKTAVAPELGANQQRLSWRIAWLDFAGTWGWHVLDNATLMAIHEKLRHFETMTWGELFGSGNKPIPTGNLCPAAQARLTELERDDEDEVWELRFGGVERVWGIRNGHVFYPLWWDPTHTVCPSTLRNT